MHDRIFPFVELGNFENGRACALDAERRVGELGRGQVRNCVRDEAYVHMRRVVCQRFETCGNGSGAPPMSDIDVAVKGV